MPYRRVANGRRRSPYSSTPEKGEFAIFAIIFAIVAKYIMFIINTIKQGKELRK